MNSANIGNRIILAVAPYYRGFGFALLEGKVLADWGNKSVREDFHMACLVKVELLFDRFRPQFFVVENHRTVDFRRAKRIQVVIENMCLSAAARKISVISFSREEVVKAHLKKATGTKADLAVAVAGRFPRELNSRMPPKRRPWMTEDPRMRLFDAVALGLMVFGFE